MKKTILMIAALCIGLAACNSNSNNSGSSDTSITKPDGVVQNATVDTSLTPNNAGSAGTAKSAGLMAASDCNACHKADIKLIGPSFKDIAAKYTRADTDKLAEKVIKGGSGVWGSAAMNPHPALKKEVVKAMVNYILAQK